MSPSDAPSAAERERRSTVLLVAAPGRCVELARTLRQCGGPYEIMHASSTEAALHAAREGVPHVVILDAAWPEARTSELLRGLTGAAGCAAVVLAAEEDACQWLRLGAHEVLDSNCLTPPSLACTLRRATERFTLAADQRERETQLHQNREQLQLLLHMGDEARLETDPHRIVASAMEALRVHFNLDRTAWAEMEADEDHFTFTGCAMAPGVPSVSGHFAISEVGAEGLAQMQAGHPLIVSDSRKVPEANRQIYEVTGVVALLVVPIHRGGRMTSAIGLHSLSPREWTAAEVELTCLVAERMADAVERAHAARALQESMSFYRQTLSSIPGMVFTSTPDGACDYLSEQWLEFTGVPTAEQLGQGWLQVLHPEDRPRASAAWCAAVEGRGQYDLEYRVRRADGAYEWFKVRGRPIRDQAGRVVRWLGVASNVDDLKRAERELAERELRYRFVADAANDAIWDWDLTTNQVVWNEGVRTRFGYAVEQVLPDVSWWIEGIHPDDRPAVVGSIREHIAHRPDDWSDEYRFRRADGTYAVVMDRGRVVRDAAGHAVRMVGSMLDLTEKRRAEAELRAAEERFAFVRKSSGVGFWCCDLPFEVLDWDENVKAHFFLPKDARVTIDTFYARLHPEDREPIRAAIGRSIREHGSYDVTYRTVDPGTRAERWVRAIGRTSYAEDGTPTRFDGVSVDVTDQKRAETAVRQREHELQTLADNTPEILARFDRDLRHVFINAAVERATGRKRQEFIGKTGRELGMPPALCDQWDAALRSVFERAQPASLEFDFASPGGTLQFATLFIPELGPDQNVEHALAITRDVTEARAAEQALREAGHRKDEFLATLAHELRNPLAPIRTGIEVLRDSQLSGPKAERTLDIMDRQLTHMVRLIDDLLDVSRISRGKLQLQRQRLELKTVLDNALETSRPVIAAGGHSLVVQALDRSVSVNGDLTRLAQVVSNLLNNAAKYTPRGGRILLSTDVEGDEAIVRVSDDGRGIDPGMLPRVFDLFSQADQTLDCAQGGLGIGLSLAKKLVELHEGTISAQSRGVGFGSTFTVRLPLANAAQTPRAAATPDTTAHVPQACHQRVLVVDDNEDAAETLAMMVELEGHETTVVHDGLSALTAAKAFHPDIVFLDLGLPDMSGHEVAKQLRADPGLSHVLLCAVTGWGTEEDKEKSAEAGFDCHLVKPVDVSAIDNLLERASKGANAP